MLSWILLITFSAMPDENQCLACHDVATPTVNLEHRSSYHFEVDVGCETCHGGDPIAREEKAGHSRTKGFKARFTRTETVRLCGDCHSDVQRMKFYRVDTNVLREYRTSRHGELLAQGDKRVAICTSCHGVHDIVSKDNPKSRVYKRNIPDMCGECHSDSEKMKPYDGPTDQESEYKEGIHGQILAGERPSPHADDVPVCADCHGTHGARPAEVTQVPMVCGTCHREVYRYLRQGEHHAALIRFNEPECVDCHGNHRNTIPPEGLFTGNGEPEGNCESCHDEDEEKVLRLASKLQASADAAEALGSRFDEALGEHRGRPEALRFLEGEKGNVREARLRVLRATHSLDLEQVGIKLEELESLVEGSVQFTERVILGRPDSPAVIFLLIGVTVGGLLVVSVILAVGIIRRQRRK